MPNIGEGINDLNELNKNNYAWTTADFNDQSLSKDYEIVNKDEIFYPWKLILRNEYINHLIEYKDKFLVFIFSLDDT